MIVRARAPLRLGLAGGGTDVSPYCDVYGGYILNVTIDRYAYAVIKECDDRRVRLIASDLQKTTEIGLDGEITQDAGLLLHKCIYDYMMKTYNNNVRMPIELTTFCDAPPGSGLGSSSTLVVAIIKAFVHFLNLPLSDYDIGQLAYRLERIECGLQGGRQDQYSATFGGFNFMEFYADEHIVINPLRVQSWIQCELESSLVLFYTGSSRESANIIADQSKALKKNDTIAVEAMHKMKQEALDMKESVLRGDFNGIAEIMQKGWINKKLSAKSVSNPLIDEIYDNAMKAGAIAGKVSGAGGGGFMLFLVPNENRMQLIRCLNNYSGEVKNCHFTNIGCESWALQ